MKTLEALWWAEAARNNILPVDWRAIERLSEQLTGRPNLAAGRTKIVYDSPLVALPEGSAPNLKNKSFTITAEADVPPDGGDGMIFTQGAASYRQTGYPCEPHIVSLEDGASPWRVPERQGYVLSLVAAASSIDCKNRFR